VRNAEKNNNYRRSPSNETAYQRELAVIPANLLEYFHSLDSSVDNSVDNSVYTNHKSEIRNKNTEIRNKEERKWDTPDKLREDTGKIDEIAKYYKVPVPYVVVMVEKAENYAKSHGVIYSDYNATVRSYIRNDIDRGIAPVEKVPSRITDQLDSEYDALFRERGEVLPLNYQKSAQFIKFQKERLKELGYDS